MLGVTVIVLLTYFIFVIASKAYKQMRICMHSSRVMILQHKI